MDILVVSTLWGCEGDVMVLLGVLSVTKSYTKMGLVKAVFGGAEIISMGKWSRPQMLKKYLECHSFTWVLLPTLNVSWNKKPRGVFDFCMHVSAHIVPSDLRGHERGLWLIDWLILVLPISLWEEGLTWWQEGVYSVAYCLSAQFPCMSIALFQDPRSVSSLVMPSVTSPPRVSALSPCVWLPTQWLHLDVM